MERICEYEKCGKVFSGTKKARFCSARCRKYAHRQMKPEQTTAGKLRAFYAQHGITAEHLLKFFTTPGEPKPGSKSWQVKYAL